MRTDNRTQTYVRYILMRFSVPQFIDVEDKIFGPLTLKQGIYRVGAVGAAYLIYCFFDVWGLL